MAAVPKVFGMVTTQPSWEYTSYALKTFAKNTKLVEGDLFYLIDNDKGFGNPPNWVIPTLEMIYNDRPFSFAQNVNHVMRLAHEHKADLYFLNNDLIFSSGWIDPLLEYTQQICSPLSNREVQYEVGGFKWANVLNLADYLSHGHALRSLIALHREQHSGVQHVMSLPFFCVKIPHAVYSVVGEFDESFGRGGAEDNDYCLRAILAGFTVQYVKSSYVLHFSGKSTWSGAEGQAETAQRVKQYRQVFEAKWGTPLCKLIMDEDNSVLSSTPELQGAVQQGDMRKIVELLAPPR